MLEQLIRFWDECAVVSPPYFHPDDKAVLYQRDGRYVDDQSCDLMSYAASSRFGFPDKKLHLSLLPNPYSGDLKNADIVVLLLNPGLDLTDYYGETQVPSFRSRLVANLRQSLQDAEYPFLWLDPALCWHGGFRWWQQKLKPVLREIALRKGIRYLDAMRDLSRRFACVELFPYHSQTFGSGHLLNKLPSVHMAKQFVQDSLIGAAANGSRTIIVTRQVEAWGLAPSDNVILYSRHMTRSASLGPKSDGNKAILKRYGFAT